MCLCFSLRESFVPPRYVTEDDHMQLIEQDEMQKIYLSLFFYNDGKRSLTEWFQ